MWPFRLAGTGTNAAEVEPVTYSLDEAAEIVWRLRKIEVELSLTATVFGNSDTLTSTNTCEREIPYASPAGTNDEWTLLLPGPRAVWDYPSSVEFKYTAFSTPSVPSGWTGDIASASFLGHHHWFTVPSMAYDTDEGSQIVSRGTWPVSGDAALVKPSMDMGASVFLETFGLGDEILRFTNIPLSGWANNFSFTATIFGDSVDLNIGSTSNVVVTAASLTTTKTEWFEYRDYDGNNPVYDIATGAQLLDPLAASVP